MVTANRMDSPTGVNTHQPNLSWQSFSDIFNLILADDGDDKLHRFASEENNSPDAIGVGQFPEETSSIEFNQSQDEGEAEVISSREKRDNPSNVITN